MKNVTYGGLLLLLVVVESCGEDGATPRIEEWKRNASGPVFRDLIPSENYEAASDAHVFFADDALSMIYTGDDNGKPAIKLARGSSWDTWSPLKTILENEASSVADRHKETGFYRKVANGKHQIYYIGYDDEATYKAQIFLAEADSLGGPYTSTSTPVIPKGIIAGKDIYCITSPSVVEHQEVLHMTFIGWNNSPDKVSEVWVLGATSTDEGQTWTDFQEVDTRIGMEGQVTKVGENKFVSVRTGEYKNQEAVFYATAPHPFGPWNELEDPILVQAGAPYEKDEIIAPQITIDPASGEEVLYYTGADYNVGWWIMMAR